MEKNNYRKIYDSMKQRIEQGEIAAGSLLPAAIELANEYGVSRPTVAKVYGKLQEEGYVKAKIGQGTVVISNTHKTRKLFGLLLPGAGESEIFSIINDRIYELSNEGEFNCLWDGATASNATIRKDLIERCCETFIRRNVDGIFFSPLERVPDADEINRAICARIAAAGIALVLIDRDIVQFPDRSCYDLVGIDNYSAGFTMGRHLVEQGCEHIYFLYRPNSAYSVQQRIAGVSAMAWQSGLDFNSSHIYCVEPNDMEQICRIPIVARKSGIVCANDSTAAVLMSAFDTLGVKVQEDVLVCGYDDMKYAEHLKYPLTSYRQPCIEIADCSVELMFRRLQNSSATPVTVNLVGTISHRESTIFR